MFRGAKTRLIVPIRLWWKILWFMMNRKKQRMPFEGNQYHESDFPHWHLDRCGLLYYRKFLLSVDVWYFALTGRIVDFMHPFFQEWTPKFWIIPLQLDDLMGTWWRVDLRRLCWRRILEWIYLAKTTTDDMYMAISFGIICAAGASNHRQWLVRANLHAFLLSRRIRIIYRALYPLRSSYNERK